MTKEYINASRMEEIYNDLASRALELLQDQNDDRIIVAIAGVPGSGKTTLADHVANKINEKNSSTNGKQLAVVVPMDGFHYSLAQLDQMPDPEEAHKRRGAPFTFDARATVDLVKQLRTTTGSSIFAPTFDHKIKDPVPNGLEIAPENKVVFLEGLYLLLQDEPWCEIAGLVDEKWLITVDPDMAKLRVGKRHVAAGIEPNLESGLNRVEFNDAKNGRLVTNQSIPPDVVIQSVEEEMYELSEELKESLGAV